VPIDISLPYSVSSAAITGQDATITNFSTTVTNTAPYPVRFEATSLPTLILSSSAVNAGWSMWAMHRLILDADVYTDTRTLELSGNYRADWATTAVSAPVAPGGMLTVQVTLYVYTPRSGRPASITGLEGGGDLMIRSVRY
jgi:hypothetical protein